MMNGSRFHFHHGPFGRPGQVKRIPPLEHDAFDRGRIFAGAGIFRIPSRGDQFVPGRERNQRRKIGTRIVEPGNEGLQSLPALGKGQFAQILAAVGKQIVGAQMGRKFGEQLWRDGFAVEPLLQHVERLHAPFAQDQKLAVDGARQMQRFEQIGEAFGNIFAGA